MTEWRFIASIQTKLYLLYWTFYSACYGPELLFIVSGFLTLLPLSRCALFYWALRFEFSNWIPIWICACRSLSRSADCVQRRANRTQVQDAAENKRSPECKGILCSNHEGTLINPEAKTEGTDRSVHPHRGNQGSHTGVVTNLRMMRMRQKGK